MDEQVVAMLREALKDLKDTCEGIREDMKEHAKLDAVYWAKIDKAEGQISLIKWVGGVSGGGGVLTWLFNHFGKQ